MGSKIASETAFSVPKLLGWWAASLVAAWAIGWSHLTWQDFTGEPVTPAPTGIAPATRPATGTP